jgi:two-component system chemotaxis response regulator CheB
MRKCRVLVVDDSALCRAQLRHLLQHGGDIEVVGEATDGSAVLDLVEQRRPDLLLVDLQMPGVDGLATIERVMARCPVPILVVTGKPGSRQQDVVFEAIRRGALDLASKPSVHDSAGCERLRATVKQLARVPVVRHVGSPSAARAPVGGIRVAGVPMQRAEQTTLVGVAASAGGPAALVALLKEFSGAFPVCFAIVQHLPPGFTESFCEFLRRRIHLEVEVAFEGAAPHRGKVYLAPDDRHLVLRNDRRFGLLDLPAVDGHRPSASTLFASMAQVLAAHCVGVVLSGIGRDGVSGLSEMRSRGALTLAQSGESCAVYGMPRAALEEGAAVRTATPEELGHVITERVPVTAGSRR